MAVLSNVRANSVSSKSTLSVLNGLTLCDNFYKYLVHIYYSYDKNALTSGSRMEFLDFTLYSNSSDLFSQCKTNNSAFEYNKAVILNGSSSTNLMAGIYSTIKNTLGITSSSLGSSGTPIPVTGSVSLVDNGVVMRCPILMARLETDNYKHSYFGYFLYMDPYVAATRSINPIGFGTSGKYSVVVYKYPVAVAF